MKNKKDSHVGGERRNEPSGSERWAKREKKDWGSEGITSTTRWRMKPKKLWLYEFKGNDSEK